MNYCLADFSEDKRIARMMRDVERYKEERNSPGRDIRNSALTGAALGVLPVGASTLVAKSMGAKSKNVKKALLAYGLTGALTGVGTKMLARSFADRKGKDAKTEKKKSLLKSVGNSTLIGAGLGGVSALRLLGGKYGLKDGLGKAFNNIAAGAGIGATVGYAGGKLRNRLKKEEK